MRCWPSLGCWRATAPFSKRSNRAKSCSRCNAERSLAEESAIEDFRVERIAGNEVVARERSDRRSTGARGKTLRRPIFLRWRRALGRARLIGKTLRPVGGALFGFPCRRFHILLGCRRGALAR